VKLAIRPINNDGRYKMKKLFIALLSFLLSCAIVYAADANEDLMKKARTLFKEIPHTAPEIKGKSFTTGKIALGKMLYFEPRLSSSALISCNTCHNVGMGGADFQETSVGHHQATFKIFEEYTGYQIRQVLHIRALSNRNK
jgi:cytochrome c peroxidase